MPAVVIGDFGDFGAMQASEPGRITSRARSKLRVWRSPASGVLEATFVGPVTKKPLEVRMGEKWRSVEWAAVILPGRVMYEISGVDEKTAREAFRLAGHKLPVGFKFLIRGVL